ncbi:PepSY-associated TM helix domain-containing protein [Alteromonas oceanisediminis]|uniref:PepSY-associated TM helix domain-containing protein n=1 Tax=Alteromonas oceanisediminis TaxID=2836180 RepID=UPI001BDA307D|nr:PepSY-associated TM helix domain-containing protein [Alteromonas oceanisediminis]MBT0585980.1 PepSY domain-containing protein [Alteromonas oceanisediminis]
MKSLAVKKLYKVHSWVGLITGILLFVIAFTGALSVFGRPEIKIWANPDIRHGIEMDAAQIEAVVREQAAALPEAYHQEILIFLPGTRTYPHLTIVFEDHENQHAVLLTVDNETMSVINQREGTPREVFAARQVDIADFIVDFHADLHLGRPVGLLLTGLLGLTLMASIVTGFIIHRQKLRQLFTFRWKKSTDITLADSHRLFGVWGLLFNGVIAFTGAFLGLATVLLIPAAAFVSFSGDQEKLIDTFNTTPQPVLAQVHQPTQIAPVLTHATTFDEDMRVEVVTIYGFDDQNAKVYASGVGSEAVARQLLSYQGATGDFIEAFGQFGKVGGISAQILDLMFPLHFGNFGGIFVKLLWTLLGVSTALLPLSGMMMWIERGQRSANPQYSHSTYQRFNRLVIGLCGGLVLACAALFPAQLILHELPAISSNSFFIGSVFFGVWLLSSLFMFVIRDVKAAASVLGYITGGLLVLTVPLNIWLTGDNPVSLMLNQQWVSATIDICLLILGTLTLRLIYQLSKSKQRSKHNEASLNIQTNQQEAQ